MALEAPGQVRIEQVAALHKSLEGIGFEHFGPQVDIVGRGIPVARKQMQEMRQAMSEADGRGHADLRQHVLLECSRVQVFGPGVFVQRQVHQRAGDIFHSGKALVESAGPQDLPDQGLGHGLATEVMARKLLQDLGLQQPVFHDL